MKNIAAFISILLCAVILNVGCGNSSEDKKTEPKDTTINQDTVNVDPENFSEPH
jgi:ABC-type Fe3+-citrate transport system substrate-binding protein